MACIVHIKEETLEETYRSRRRWVWRFGLADIVVRLFACVFALGYVLIQMVGRCRRSQRGVPVLHVRRDVDAVDAIADAGEFA